jgi:very-short-patch-repair endonuclease
MSLTKSPQLVVAAKMTARDLRKKQTEGEQIFWEAVRN